MEYEIQIYSESQDKLSRFTLGTKGQKTLFVIGLNPSIANEIVPDYTIKKVMSFAEQAGFDSFVMFNLYPLRTPYPDDLHNEIDMILHQENIEKIVSTLNNIQNPTVVASWGQTIKVRSFFIECLRDIYHSTLDFNIKWLKIGDLTKNNHPRHPSRAPYKLGLTPFDIQQYLDNNSKL